MQYNNFAIKVLDFLDSCHDFTDMGYSSIPKGLITLYGTCYALLTKSYLGITEPVDPGTIAFIQNCQDSETGYFVGPELVAWIPSTEKAHSKEHLLTHLTCTVLPCLKQFNIPALYPIRFSHAFCDIDYLREWMDRRDLHNAWLEGNNILFVGQLLVYLRDIEHHQQATPALEYWFEWLDAHMDQATNLWGTNGYCSAMEAVYGGYHQLLVYYHENRSIANYQGLVDTVLSLQHHDGGFNPKGNGGACEDVDCVDILVNMYKRFDYRRGDIRVALRRCLRHILALQNPDGGFPYNRNQEQSHMGIPATFALPNTSTTFATWFRVHTLALIAQVLPNEPALRGISFRFNNSLGMGWHQVWDLIQARRMAQRHHLYDHLAELSLEFRHNLNAGHHIATRFYRAGRRRTGLLLRRIGLR